LPLTSLNARKRRVRYQKAIHHQEGFNVKRSAEFMSEYLKNGELNPAVIATPSGFLCLFVAWILDESLPWTTGEAPTLHLLLKYLKR
jgi:hypothetical protein